MKQILVLLLFLPFSTFAQRHWKVKVTGTATTTLTIAPVSATTQTSDFYLTATSNSPATKTFGTTNAAVAYVNTSSGLVHVVAAGTVTFTCSQPAVTGYTSASYSLPVTITEVVPVVTTTINVTAIPNHNVGDADFYVYSSSNSTAPKSYTSDNPAVATVNATTGLIHVIAAGTYTVTVSQAAVTGFTSASASTTGSVLSAPTIAGVTYYVDPTYTGSTSNGAQATPFKSIAAINTAINNTTTIPLGGITYAIKAGTTLTGHLYASGKTYTQNSPLTITTFGPGAAPRVKHDMSGTNSANRTIFYFDNCSYVTVNGLELIDTTMSPLDHNITANVGYAFDFENGSHNTVKNCNISLVGIGVQLASSYSSVLNCKIQNLRMVRNTPVATNSNDDYGANGIVNSGSYNLIDGNYIRDCWAMSYDYGFDGGSIEYFGSCSNLTVTHNTCINGIGFMEFGAPAGSGAQSNDNLIAYNVLINNGHEFYINTSGASFSISVHNLQFFNNVVIENSTDSKFQYGWLIGQSNSSTTANIVNLRNNLFYIGETTAIINNALNANGQVTHKNNVYRMTAGSIPYTLDASEVNVGTAAIFQNTTSADPSLWNFQLLGTSTALNKGADLRTVVVGAMPITDFYGSTINYSTNPEPGVADYVLQ